MIGTTVGSYRVTAKVSVGGMGTVYKAEHSLIGKQAAVKVLHPELRGNREVVQRFFNEAKATTHIKHPGIVEIFDFGYLPSGDGFIVMEFLEGVSLARRLKKYPKMPEGEAAVLMRSVCSALAAAHAKGIVHRDLKPDNIFLCPDSDAPTGERPKILDFGIAKLNVGLTGPGNATKTGAVMGTPTYMSPEQCRGTGEVDHRADLYSIGCMVYEMVAGRPPFDDMGPGELLGAHLFMQPQPPTSYGAEVSPAAEQLIMALLEKNPDKRQPHTAVELARRFGELAQGHGLVSRVTPTALQRIDYGPDDDEQPAPSTTSESSNAARHSAEGIAPTMPSTPGVGSNPSIVEPVPEVTVASQPTTLSGAASQSVLRNKSSRVGLAVGALAALLIAGGAVMFAMKGNESKPAAAPAATPTTGPETAAPTPPAPTPPAPTPPAPTPPPVEVATPPVATPTPPPVETAQTPAETATSKKDHKKPKPTTTKPAVTTTKPTTTKPTTTKPTTTKPTEKPKPGTGSGSSILIETDI